MNISKEVKLLSTEGIVSILNEHSHVILDTIEGREELEQVLQINLNDGLIDEIEVLTVISGEIA